MALEMKYFVLKPKAKGKNDLFARASQEAMRMYADIIKEINPELAKSLKTWVDKERIRQIKLAL